MGHLVAASGVRTVVHEAIELALGALGDGWVERHDIVLRRAPGASPRAQLVALPAALLLCTAVALNLAEQDQGVLARGLPRRRAAVDPDGVLPASVAW